jgi:hypothetical protein
MAKGLELQEMYYEIAVFSAPMAKSAELQEINFKTKHFLSTIKRGATKMFCRELGSP